MFRFFYLFVCKTCGSQFFVFRRLEEWPKYLVRESLKIILKDIIRHSKNWLLFPHKSSLLLFVRVTDADWHKFRNSFSFLQVTWFLRIHFKAYFIRKLELLYYFPLKEKMRVSKIRKLQCEELHFHVSYRNLERVLFPPSKRKSQTNCTIIILLEPIRELNSLYGNQLNWMPRRLRPF